ncbi:SLBB domain-containing protein, partial [Candidatus Desantisbacteria bacterium]|nr:SLBB domain-containing protein [Candidatus Desantisbacteria bacterium]
GDTIYVPFLGEEGTLLTSEIYILGQVARPGKYTFPVMPNVLEAITQAGGGLPQASLRAVRILRGDMKKPEIIIANLEKFLETGDPKLIPQLKPGDTIYVPVLGDEGDLVTREEKTKNIINIIGEVRVPGSYPLTDPIPLLQAILMSGGPTFTAELSKIKIITNVQKVSPMKEYNVKEYDFNKYLDNADLKNNPMVYAGDTIVIPKYVFEGITLDREEPKSDIIYVLGEAVKPGTYQLKYNTNLWHILQLSGGPTSEAQIDEIKIVKGYGNTGYPKTLIVNMNDYMDKSDFTGLPKLQNGDTVILPKKSHFWRETVKFFSEIAIILGVVNLISK